MRVLFGIWLVLVVGVSCVDAQTAIDLDVQTGGEHPPAHRLSYQDRAVFSADGKRLAVTYLSRLHCFDVESGDLLGSSRVERQVFTKLHFLGNDHILTYLLPARRWAVISVDDLVNQDNGTLETLPMEHSTDTVLNFFGQLPDGELLFGLFDQNNDSLFEKTLEEPFPAEGKWSIVTRDGNQWTTQSVGSPIAQVHGGRAKPGSMVRVAMTRVDPRMPKAEGTFCLEVSAAPGPVRLARVTEIHDGADTFSKNGALSIRCRTQVTPISLTLQGSQLISDTRSTWMVDGVVTTINQAGAAALSGQMWGSDIIPSLDATLDIGVVQRSTADQPERIVVANPALSRQNLPKYEWPVFNWHGKAGWVSVSIKRMTNITDRKLDTSVWIANNQLSEWSKLSTGKGLGSQVIAVSEDGRSVVTITDLSATKPTEKRKIESIKKRWRLFKIDR